MSRPRWWSQPVAAEGSTASEGIRRQLGRPRLDPLEVLVRETAQNTCDAGLPGHDVEYTIRLRTLRGDGLAAWQDLLLPEPPSSALGLEESMRESPLVIVISDRGTTGLGGPLRADEIPRDGEQPDFVNFVRNVGEHKNVDLGGGSYGFGKGILYNVSRCHTIVVDSVCLFRGRRQRRLMAAALGDGYTDDGRRFTGRHWLGLGDDGHTRPLLDGEAETAARRLGLPEFDAGATGTTIAVIDADLGSRRVDDSSRTDRETLRGKEDAARFLASAMLWNLWPRMLADRTGRLCCSVRFEGSVVEVPDPESTIELHPFVQAYRQLSTPGEYSVPARKSEPSEIGRFAIVDAMAPVKKNAGSVVSAAAPFHGAAHHCARMRQADLVVDYEPGEPPTDEMLQYGAVFRASAAADPYFAEAEPPTHDSWVTNGLSGTALGVVRLAATFVRRQLHERVAQARPPTPSGSVPLAALSRRLSGLLAAPADAAQASAGSTSTSGSSVTGRRGTPRFVEGPDLAVENGRAVVRAVVRFPQWRETRIVVARPRVVVDAGLENADEGLPAPEVLDWRDTEGSVRRPGAELELRRQDPRLWTVTVAPPPDAVVRLALDVEAAP